MSRDRIHFIFSDSSQIALPGKKSFLWFSREAGVGTDGTVTADNAKFVLAPGVVHDLQTCRHLGDLESSPLKRFSHSYGVGANPLNPALVCISHNALMEMCDLRASGETHRTFARVSTIDWLESGRKELYVPRTKPLFRTETTVWCDGAGFREFDFRMNRMVFSMDLSRGSSRTATNNFIDPVEGRAFSLDNCASGLCVRWDFASYEPMYSMDHFPHDVDLQADCSFLTATQFYSSLKHPYTPGSAKLANYAIFDL